MDIGSSVAAFTSIPLDWIIIVVFFLVVSADAVRSGPAHAYALSLAMPIALFVFQLVPQTTFLNVFDTQFQASAEQAFIFAILVVVFFVCIHQMLYAFDRSTSLLLSAVVGFATTVIVLVMWVQIPALQSLWHFDPQIQAVFGASYRFFWLLGSYLALAFAGS